MHTRTPVIYQHKSSILKAVLMISLQHYLRQLIIVDVQIKVPHGFLEWRTPLTGGDTVTLETYRHNPRRF